MMRGTSLSPSSAVNIRMKITELTRPADIEQANRVLNRSGYRDITKEPGHGGGGAYAEVLWRADLPYVVKLFVKSDEAYLRYLRLITSVSNPHFPIVRGRPMRVNDSYYAVRLERLTPIVGGPAENLRYFMEQCLEGLTERDADRMRAAAQHLPQSAKTAIAHIYRWCIQKYPGTVIDLHKHNAMLRGNTIVIIDPIANPE